jgi:carbonic anhydrase
MTIIDEILEHNKQFVENKEYEKYITSRFPDKKMVILTCMDTRLVELLTKALNLRNGDAKIIRNAGAIITQPFGNIMRSILVAIYELGASEVLVIGHHECGMTGLNSDAIMDKVRERGISEETINIVKHSGIQVSRWLTGFDTVQEGVETSVDIIRNHPLLPRDIPVHGMIIHPVIGKLDYICDGYEYLESVKK